MKNMNKFWDIAGLVWIIPLIGVLIWCTIISGLGFFSGWFLGIAMMLHYNTFIAPKLKGEKWIR